MARESDASEQATGEKAAEAGRRRDDPSRPATVGDIHHALHNAPEIKKLQREIRMLRDADNKAAAAARDAQGALVGTGDSTKQRWPWGTRP